MADKEEKTGLDTSSEPGEELSQDDIDKLMNADAGASASGDGSDPGQDKLAEEWAKALDAGEDIEEGKPLGGDVGHAQFDELKETKAAGPSKDLDFILDIPLEVTVEMGRTRMLINDLLQLGQGSVIELNRLAGEPLDILINNKLVARGEVVVVSEKFGIRITDIVSPLERVKRLR
ncbi:MAG: flagellar motor switch protein FliN [Deltaproteobacteria bacterium]|nr:flagellar motor switch protein FliN [Deltaproteobacteria bacterium]